ncbi:MAG: repeat-containing protein, partial [Verrucomicrobiales bacterium]|nr:repeat-containing protein [Verrucomicrobiales bacterium]
RAHALLRQAQYLVSQNRRPEAKPLLEEIRHLSPTPAIAAWTAWVAGQSEYDAAAYRAASGFFRDASSTSPDPSLRAAAAYNAALSELQEGTLNPARSLALLDSSPLPEYKLAGAEFHLERALHLASKGDPDAADGLQAFADSLPDHPRRFDALIALAELALRADPPRPQDAARLHADALAAATQPWQQERAALLDCYIAEATPPTGNAPASAASADAFTAKVVKFLTAFPLSAARTDLRMKTAQIAYQREDFSGARQLFETLAADDPLHPLAEPALFWAGRAALLTMEPSSARQAVGFWEKVYELNGPLKWQARLQEAMLNQRQNQPAAALQLLDELLAPTAAPGPDPATRWQSLLVKGEILAAPAMKPEEQALGLKAFDQVITASGLPPAFKNQALVRKGVCLGTLKRHDEALEAYYDVLTNGPPAPNAAASPDDYWFHRAGTKALVLLERAGKSEEAIEIAKKLAKAPGPRGRAAAELVDELAFKYGIWTSSP